MDNDHKFFALRNIKVALVLRKSKANSILESNVLCEEESIDLIKDQIHWLDDMITATNLLIEESLKPEIPF